jgi:hypothetical protein
VQHSYLYPSPIIVGGGGDRGLASNPAKPRSSLCRKAGRKAQNMGSNAEMTSMERLHQQPWHKSRGAHKEAKLDKVALAVTESGISKASKTKSSVFLPASLSMPSG